VAALRPRPAEPCEDHIPDVRKTVLFRDGQPLLRRNLGALFNRAKRSHEQQFQQSGKAINEKGRLYWRIGHALLEAKQAGWQN
jgi:hypothetical protein